jgi:hypothetical protein
MSDDISFDKPITYLSVINITGDDSNSIGTVLGEIKTDTDVDTFNALTDKTAKITSFKDAITHITNNGHTIVEPATTTIIIEGLVSGNQYEFAKINSGDLTNFNSYTLADKKTKVQELISSVLLSDSSSADNSSSESVDSSEESECQKLPGINNKLELTNLIACLEKNNPSANSNVMIQQIIDQLKEKQNSSFTNSEITEILSKATADDSAAIIKKCVTSKKTQLIEAGKGKSFNVKNSQKEEIPIGEDFIPSSIVDSTLSICGTGAVIALVAPILSTLAFYASVMPKTFLSNLDLASISGGGRPKKKTRKRKSRKSRKTKKRKGKGRSRKIKRKHR